MAIPTEYVSDRDSLIKILRKISSLKLVWSWESKKLHSCDDENKRYNVKATTKNNFEIMMKFDRPGKTVGLSIREQGNSISTYIPPFLSASFRESSDHEGFTELREYILQVVNSIKEREKKERGDRRLLQTQKNQTSLDRFWNS
jgi:hypothetical protein